MPRWEGILREPPHALRTAPNFSRRIRVLSMGLPGDEGVGIGSGRDSEPRKMSGNRTFALRKLQRLPRASRRAATLIGAHQERFRCHPCIPSLIHNFENTMDTSR